MAAYPYVSARNGGVSTSDQWSTIIDLAALVGPLQIDDLILVLLAQDENATITPPAGWTYLAPDDQLFYYETGRFVCYGRSVAGGDPTTVTFTHSEAQGVAYQVYKIQHWYGTMNNLTCTGFSDRFQSLTPDAPWGNPAGWGTADLLVIAFCAWDGGDYTNCTAAPTGYANLRVDRGAVGGSVGLATAYAFLTADTVNPDTFTLTQAEQSLVGWIAVRYGDAGGGRNPMPMDFVLS